MTQDQIKRLQEENKELKKELKWALQSVIEASNIFIDDGYDDDEDGEAQFAKDEAQRILRKFNLIDDKEPLYV